MTKQPHGEIELVYDETGDHLVFIHKGEALNPATVAKYLNSVSSPTFQ